MKVVFHIDEQKKWAELQANVRNFFVAKPQATIVVVANGAAVQGFLLADFYDFFATIPAQLHACQNALRVQKIDFHALPTTVQIVPSGVVDLVELQQKGFAYIKP
jgi:intracellular sulfur oxidation DsrE/DsrF family protein